MSNQRNVVPAAKAEVKAGFLKEFRANRVVIVTGPTGSGKTTMLTKYILDVIQRGKTQKILCTQPRRIAAIGAAKQVAKLEKCKIGTRVGYHVRSARSVADYTQLTFATDGMAIVYMEGDAKLSKYTTLVVDEVHEQGTNTELILAMAKLILQQRPEFRLVIMSATMSVDKFQAYFPGSGKFHVPGRTYPVEIIYFDDDLPAEVTYLEAALKTTFDIIDTEPRGDIMVFLPTEADVSAACYEMELCLRAYNEIRTSTHAFKVCALHGHQMPFEQEAAINRFNGQKIIFATSVAETSITVEGLVYIVDCGWQRTKLHDIKTDTSKMPIAAITKAQAAQRAGRVGRTQKGKCFRLYTEESYRLEFLSAPVGQVSMERAETTVLKLLKLEEAAGTRLELLTTMTDLAYEHALEELILLDLLNHKTGKLTDMGRRAAEYPLPAHLARMLLGCFTDCPSSRAQSEILTLVSLLSLENTDVFQVLSDERAQELQRTVAMQFAARSIDSDHITLINVFIAWWAQPAAKRTQWCADHFVNERALIKAAMVRRQLWKRVNKDFNLNGQLVSLADGDADTIESNFGILQALWESAGTRWAKRIGNNKYVQVGNPKSRVMLISKGSPAHGTKENYLVYDECIWRAEPVMMGVTAVPADSLFDSYGVTKRRQALDA